MILQTPLCEELSVVDLNGVSSIGGQTVAILGNKHKVRITMVGKLVCSLFERSPIILSGVVAERNDGGGGGFVLLDLQVFDDDGGVLVLRSPQDKVAVQIDDVRVTVVVVGVLFLRFVHGLEVESVVGEHLDGLLSGGFGDDLIVGEPLDFERGHPIVLKLVSLFVFCFAKEGFDGFRSFVKQHLPIGSQDGLVITKPHHSKFLMNYLLHRSVIGRTQFG